jgi:hypothetical protein
MGADAGSVRARLFRAVHAEGLKRGMGHAELREVCRERYGVASMQQLDDEKLQELYRGWTGHGLRRRTAMPKKGSGRSVGLAEMVTGEDLQTLANAFAARGWGKETQREFIRRQLGGREQIRTRGDFWKVFSGVRAMNRRGNRR